MTGKKNPADLLIVMGIVFLTNIFVLTPGLSETIFRNIIGMPFVLFLPGYALIAALFTGKSDLDEIERITLSFGLSIAIVPLIGLGLNYTSWGIRLHPVLISLSTFTVIMCGLAYIRRSKLSEAEAFKIPFRETVLSLKAETLERSKSKLDRAITVFLILSIFLSVATLLYVIVTPKEGEHFTEFYILGPEGKADNYTTNYTLGQSETVIVGIVNHEYGPVNYTMRLKLENKSLTLPTDTQQITLAHNETWEKPVTFTPPFKGQGMKLEFLLFNETDRTEPYRDLHLWVNVSTTENS